MESVQFVGIDSDELMTKRILWKRSGEQKRKESIDGEMLMRMTDDDGKRALS